MDGIASMIESIAKAGAATIAAGIAPTAALLTTVIGYEIRTQILKKVSDMVSKI